MRDKICFVIMGFGEKTDLVTGTSFNLDNTYHFLVKPALSQAGYNCVRADLCTFGQRLDSNSIALLKNADLVIADASLSSQELLHPLEIRKSWKPFSTIVMKQKGIGKIPIEADQSYTLTYPAVREHACQLKQTIESLKGLIRKLHSLRMSEEALPVKTLPDIHEHLPSLEYQTILQSLSEKENYILAVAGKAKEYMKESAFDDAYFFWEKAGHVVTSEKYFIQQLGLSKYKSRKPSIGLALRDAAVIMEELHPTCDPEALGISGAIYKNLYLKHNNIQYLDRAIEYYAKGFKTCQSYYNGENYALCLEMKASKETEEIRKSIFKQEATQIRTRIYDYLKEYLVSEDFEQRPDKKWIFATLAHCSFLKQCNEAHYYERKFLESAVKWERQTYLQNKEESLKLCQN